MKFSHNQQATKLSLLDNILLGRSLWIQINTLGLLHISRLVPSRILESPMNVLCHCLLAVSLCIPLAAEDVMSDSGADSDGLFSMAFRDAEDPTAWALQLRSKLKALLAVPQIDVPLAPKTAKEADAVDHIRYRISFAGEKGQRVPGFLLIPKSGKGPFPVMICLQGTTEKGMKQSLDPDARGGRGFAAAAISQGWAALAIEQQPFGERRKDFGGKRGSDHHESLSLLKLGRTMTGNRVLDLTRAIDFVESQPELDSKMIACIGHSAGGTVAFYGACLDKRIRLAVVSCSFCTYADSWQKHRKSPSGYIPGVMKYADMSDLGGLIAPRDLLIVAGEKDKGASIAGVKKGFEHTKRIYTAFQKPDHVQLVIGKGGHDFFPDLAWPKINDIKKQWALEDVKDP